MSALSASDGAVAYWPEVSDVIPSDPTKNTASKLNSPPTGWPDCFKENATLKALLGKKALAGKRVRLTGLPSKEDAAKYASVAIYDEDSFGNAEAVEKANKTGVRQAAFDCEQGSGPRVVFLSRRPRPLFSN